MKFFKKLFSPRLEALEPRDRFNYALKTIFAKYTNEIKHIFLEEYGDISIDAAIENMILKQENEKYHHVAILKDKIVLIEPDGLKNYVSGMDDPSVSIHKTLSSTKFETIVAHSNQSDPKYKGKNFYQIRSISHRYDKHRACDAATHATKSVFHKYFGDVDFGFITVDEEIKKQIKLSLLDLAQFKNMFKIEKAYEYELEPVSPYLERYRTRYVITDEQYDILLDMCEQYEIKDD